VIRSGDFLCTTTDKKVREEKKENIRIRAKSDDSNSSSHCSKYISITGISCIIAF